MSQNPDFPSDREAADLVRRVAEPRLVDDSVKGAIRRAARKLGWSFSRTRHVWYRTAAVRAGEIDQLRATAAEAKREKRPIRDEYSDLRKRISRLERHLDLMDEADALEASDVVREGADGGW